MIVKVKNMKEFREVVSDSNLVNIDLFEDEPFWVEIRADGNWEYDSDWLDEWEGLEKYDDIESYRGK